ncbi:hypothetical protein J6TS2_45400 [Heyndrickxia sporothermodurans]|nr:hypothetical protein J6TS2_45400 [Heyndrickxia sporothermodurans]
MLRFEWIILLSIYIFLLSFSQYYINISVTIRKESLINFILYDIFRQVDFKQRCIPTYMFFKTIKPIIDLYFLLF